MSQEPSEKWQAIKISSSYPGSLYCGARRHIDAGDFRRNLIRLGRLLDDSNLIRLGKLLECSRQPSHFVCRDEKTSELTTQHRDAKEKISDAATRSSQELSCVARRLLKRQLVLQKKDGNLRSPPRGTLRLVVTQDLQAAIHPGNTHCRCHATMTQCCENVTVQ